MKIVTTDNFNRELSVEKVIAENVNSHFGESLVSAWNTIHCSETSETFLKLVEDDYEPYDGYAVVYGHSREKKNE